jgi:flagellar biosynthesis protein FlhF
MINETFVDVDPQRAYNEAMKKYGTEISLVSAKQIKDDEGNLRSEVVISIPKDVFMEKSFVSKMPESADESLLLSELGELKEQINFMKEGLHKEIQNDSEVITKVKGLFLKKGISEEWLEKIIMSLVGSEIMDDANLLVPYILEEIDEVLQTQEEDLSKPKVMMFVGPTGVGKTTTIAKLAARYSFLMDTQHKVGLINLDSFKVGASEQLGQYAKIMELEHIVASTPEAFKEALAHFKGCDVVLVDTAGMSPFNTEKFIKNIEYIKVQDNKEIEVSLVLPATVKYEDMKDIYSNFSFLDLSSLVITKFDETQNLGTLLNFMLIYGLPMSYFSVGQEVPDDLFVAKKEFLLERFIGDVCEG